MKHLVFAFALCAAVSASALDLREFVQETQRMTKKENRITIVWWVPTAYWEATMNDSTRITAKARDEMLTTFDAYTIVIVASVESGAFGTLKPVSKSDILDGLELKVDGKVVTPLADNQLSGAMKNFTTMLKPVLTAALGQLGQGLEMIIYSNTKDGKKILDPTKPGALNCKLFGESYAWKLPLGCLMPPKVDPVTGESFPGNYNFNPFSGGKLQVK